MTDHQLVGDQAKGQGRPVAEHGLHRLMRLAETPHEHGGSPTRYTPSRCPARLIASDPDHRFPLDVEDEQQADLRFGVVGG